MMKAWKDIDGFSDYQVSSDGQVKSLARRIAAPHGNTRLLPEKILKQADWGGYPAVVLYRDTKRHRRRVAALVLENFIGPCPAHLEKACHNDGNAWNSTVNNLRWDTRKNNHADKRRHGTMLTAWPKTKLNPDQVREIRNNPQISGREFSRRFGVIPSTISAIRHGRLWANIT